MINKSKLLETKMVVNNSYLNKYIQLINSNWNTEKQLGYDRHHIIPVHFYKYNNLPIDNSENNIINLSRSDHILAHLYLCFCSIGYYKYSNACAVKFFLNIKHNKYITYNIENIILTHKKELDECAKLCAKLHSELRKGKPSGIITNKNKIGLTYKGHRKFVVKSEVNKYLEKGAVLGFDSPSHESIEHNRLSHLGKKLPHTKEWNKAISNGSKGKKLSKECKQKISNTLKGNTEKCGHIRGKIAINNGKIYKYVFEQDFINTYQFQGWTRGNGNLHKNTCKNKNKIRINNESGAKYVTIEEWENKYSKEGWHRGYDWKK